LLGMSSDMSHCIICKEFVNKRYTLKAVDKKTNVHIEGYVCADCWNNLLASHHNEGLFKISKLLAWTKGKKDSIRHL